MHDRLCTIHVTLQEFEKKFPISHEISLDHGVKPVSALGLDPSGARVVTGGYDYEVKFWDFAGMDSSFRSFRTIQPCQRCVCGSIQRERERERV